MKITKPGFYEDMPASVYHADPCPSPSLTQSIAKILIEQSPAHARLAHPRLAPPATEEDAAEKYVAAKVIGDAAHAMMIGRGKLIAEGNFDSWRTKDSQAFRAEAEAAGKLAILSKHLARAAEMVKAASYQLDPAGHTNAFRIGKGEVVLAWQEGDLWFRTMIDWMIDTCHPYDLKTTGLSVAPHVAIERPSLEGWDIQAAMHERGLNALDPANAGRRAFHYINQENEPPYALVPVRISEHDLTMGRKKLDHAVEIWRRCIESNTWPLYPAETIMSRPRAWTESRWLERELERDERGGRDLPREIDPSLIMAG